MGWLFSSTKSEVSNTSRDLYRTECPDEAQPRKQLIDTMTKNGHRVTGYLGNDDDYQPLLQQQQEQQRRKR